MNIKEKIAVMQAFADGKVVQFWHPGEMKWEDAPRPVWNWNDGDYRIKPAEPRTFYMNEYKHTDESGTFLGSVFKDKDTAENVGKRGRGYLSTLTLVEKLDD